MSIALDTDVERRIADKVESGQYTSPSEVVTAALELLDAREDNTENSVHPIWEMIAAIGREVPDEEWAKVPTDAAADPDKYLYSREKLVG